jgi:hypothetical protein
MADYYNKTNGPVSVVLRDGNSLLIARKSWQSIAPADEGHTSLQRALDKGELIRRSPPIVVAAAAPVAPVVAEPVVETVPPTESEPKAPPVAPVVRSGRKGR